LNTLAETDLVETNCTALARRTSTAAPASSRVVEKIHLRLLFRSRSASRVNGTREGEKPHVDPAGSSQRL